VTAIGDAEHPDVKNVADGIGWRQVYGVDLQADAIRALASNNVPELPTLDDQVWALLVAFVLGATAAVRMYNSPAWRRRAVLLTLVLAWWGAAWLLARSNMLLDVVNDSLAIVLAATTLRALQTVAWRYKAFKRISV